MVSRSQQDTPKLHLFMLILIVYMVGFAIADFVLDVPKTMASAHFMVEAGLITLGCVLATYLWLGWRESQESLARIRRALEQQKEERARWQQTAQRLLNGLGEQIDQQLKRWQLTRTESEIALLLIKGYSHQQIADLLGKSERTVRQHGGSVYKKSGLAGRAELAAFFLEDLLLPQACAEDGSAEEADPAG